MASISTQIDIVDNMSSTLYNIMGAVNEVIYSMQSVDNAIDQGFDDSSIDSARRAIDLANAELDETLAALQRNTDEQENFNKAASSGTSILKTLGTMAAAIGLGVAITAGASYMYEAATTLEATEAKFQTVFAGYEDVAQGIVDEFQILTPATEASTQSMISGIQDLLIPMGFARDAATDMTGETMTLVGALTNFNSATHSAEDVASAFQSALTGEYTSLKALGIQVDATTIQEEVLAMGLAETTDEITSQMEAQALLALAYEQSGDALAAYNEESLDTVTRMGLLQSGFTDTFAEAGQSLLPTINELLAQVQAHMPTITTLIYGFADGFGVVLSAASSVFEIVMGIVGFMVENWAVIEPLVLGIATAFGLYTAALIANNAVQVISNGLTALAAIKTSFLTAMTTSWSIASFQATLAQQGLNAALLACPITWILLIIIAVIAAIYGIVAAINTVTGSTISATGIICGALAVAGAFIWNLILGVVNAVIGIGIELYNLIATFANFFANVFNDPVGAIITLFSGMFDFILGIVQAAASLIDTVLGTDMASAVEGFRNTVADATAEIVGEQTVVMEQLSASDYQFDGIDYGDAWDAGYSFGEGVADTIGDTFSDVGTDASAGYEQSGLLENIESIAADTGSISDSVSESEEMLEYLRDVAEQEAVNRFTTAEIKIEMTNNNSVSSNVDLDGMVEHLVVTLEEAMASSAEGVHT